MLNTIKKIITDQKIFQEAADFILEDEQIDDSIILGEEDETSAEPDDDDSSKLPVENPAEPGESLPEPVGAQTGEPAVGGDDLLLSTEIDLVNNTSKDSLPTPPINASDAIEGDVLDMKVDSGFGGDDEGESKNDDSDLLDEAIGEATFVEGVQDVISKHEQWIRDYGKFTHGSEALLKMSQKELSNEISATDRDNRDYRMFLRHIIDEYNKTIERSKEEISTNIALVKKIKAANINESSFSEDELDMIAEAAKYLDEDELMEFIEAISIGGDDEGGEAPADEPAGDPLDEPVEGDNQVTSAVKEKINDATSEDDTTTGGGDNKEKLFNKLSNITKSIEDIKSSLLKETN